MQTTAADPNDANAAAWAKYYADKKAYDEQQATIAQQWQVRDKPHRADRGIDHVCPMTA